MGKSIYNYKYLQDYCDTNNITLNKDYSNIFVKKSSLISAKCISCNNDFEKKFEQILNTDAYCKGCGKKKRNERCIETCLKRYGVEHSLQSTSIRDKSQKTIKEKYGVNNVSQSNEIKEKKKTTCLQNHGVECSFFSKEIRKKIKDTFTKNYGVDYPFKSDTIKKQIVETNLEKFGVENPQQSEEVKDKTKNTCLEKYGVKYCLQNKETREKIKKTCLEKYGVEYPNQNKEIYEKIKKTNLEKYGFEYVMQNPEIAEKNSKKSYYKKEYYLPSGKELIIQGYEHFALDELIGIENIDESDIVTGVKNVPTIWYEDVTGKKHRHYVDIYIPSQKRCIEVKSTWTVEKKKDSVFLKQNAGKQLGYAYEIWVYDHKGVKVNCYD